MFIYNITFHIEDDILQECLSFLKEEYIPLATDSGFLHTPFLRRVLPYQDEEAVNCYAVQFSVKNIDSLNYWIEHEGLQLSKRLVQKFGSKVAGFTTVLEDIDL